MLLKALGLKARKNSRMDQTQWLSRTNRKSLLKGREGCLDVESGQERERERTLEQARELQQESMRTGELRNLGFRVSFIDCC